MYEKKTGFVGARVMPSLETLWLEFCAGVKQSQSAVLDALLEDLLLGDPAKRRRLMKLRRVNVSGFKRNAA